jgi:methyl-accepting chemotaxis protein
MATIEFSAEGIVLNANRNFLRAVGYSLDEIRGRHHRIFVAPAEAESPQYEEFWARLRSGQEVRGVVSRVAKDGSAIYLNATYCGLPGPDGRPARFMKFAIDVTAETMASKQATMAQSMLENCPVNVMFADKDLVLRYMNRASREQVRKYQAHLPFPADQMIGRSIDVFHKNPSHQRRLLANPSSLPHSANIKLGPETLEVNVWPVHDHRGEYAGAMVNWQVLTERLAAQEREKQASEHAARTANELSQSAGQLTDLSQQLSAAAEETAAQASLVSAASEQVSRNVEGVSTGAGQMMAAIREIASSANESARVAGQAVTAAASTNQTITRLGSSGVEIGKVIKVIATIAQQTNLLALNATIEAARAGESGRGFAVVANEVKELAKETAKATEEIGSRIEAIQSDTRDAVSDIGQMTQIIHQINDLCSVIASAVEEQTATTNEIGRNISEAAKGVSEIARSVSGVAQAAGQTSGSATSTLQTAQAVSGAASQLDELVRIIRGQGQLAG